VRGPLAREPQLHPGNRLPEADQLPAVTGPERAAGEAEVDCFQKVGLARPVITHDRGDASLKLELEPSDAAEVAHPEARCQHPLPRTTR
jgi:hypothetical protein